MLKASHMRMKRAALSAESESRMPPFCIGWLATTPTCWPAGTRDAHDYVLRPRRLDLEPGVAIEHRLDHALDVVRRAWAGRHDLVEPIDEPISAVVGGPEGRLLRVAGRQIRKEPADHGDALAVVGHLVVAHARLVAVNLRAAHVVSGHLR